MGALYINVCNMLHLLYKTSRFYYKWEGGTQSKKMYKEWKIYCEIVRNSDFVNKSKKTISSVLKSDYALVQHTRTYLSSYCQSTINPSTNVGNSSHLFIIKNI